MEDLSIAKLRAGLDNLEFSSQELTQYYLKQIQKQQTLNAFISINEEQALLAAKNADLLIHAGKAHTLTGIPLAHKDNFCTLEIPTTCGSKMLERFVSPYQATIVERLAAEQTVMLGKTNMDEFAMGSTNETSYFGTVKNPWKLTCSPGGSSGGSAAAIAANMAPFATGSDTGGSIRQPASFCGVSGLKPTYGLVSRFGLVAFASSLDQAGPIAKSAEDLSLIMQTLAGFDEKDSTSIKSSPTLFTQKVLPTIKGMKIGLPSCFFHQRVEEPIQTAIKSALKVFEQAGAEIIPVDLSLQALWVPCYYIIACAEASSNLSRYDGVRFGYQSKNPSSFNELITQTRDEAFGIEVKRRILTGTYVLSEGYFDAYYKQAQKVRRMIRDELLQTLSGVDVLMGPTTPTCAFLLGNAPSNPSKRYQDDEFTVAANLSGIPALSIPAGFSPDGLPIGLQIMGKHFSDATLLQLGQFFQQATSWHKQTPKELS